MRWRAGHEVTWSCGPTRTRRRAIPSQFYGLPRIARPHASSVAPVTGPRRAAPRLPGVRARARAGRERGPTSSSRAISASRRCCCAARGAAAAGRLRVARLRAGRRRGAAAARRDREPPGAAQAARGWPPRGAGLAGRGRLRHDHHRPRADLLSDAFGARGPRSPSSPTACGSIRTGRRRAPPRHRRAPAGRLRRPSLCVEGRGRPARGARARAGRRRADRRRARAEPDLARLTALRGAARARGSR